MDPLTAFSLVGNIIQVLDFTHQLFHGVSTYYKSGAGALPVNEELELITTDLSDFITKLSRPLKVTNPATNDSSIESLQALCEGCKKVADELLGRLNDLKVNGRHQAWKSFRAAIKAAWSAKEIEALDSRLMKFRMALELEAISELRTKTNELALQQSQRFDDQDKQTQNIITALLDTHGVLAKDLDDQTLAIAQMLNHTEVVITSQHDRTRALIIDVMKQNLSLSNNSQGYITASNNEKTATVRKEEEDIKLLVENSILDMLYFKTMPDRQEEITKAHGKTFSWVFKPAPAEAPNKNNFTEWLRHGRGTFWISGKAGSGKSTLMRYICESPATQRELLVWSGETPVTMCNFFFWNSGTIEQRSQLGLLRSIVYRILQQHTDLIPIVMPSVWARTYSQAMRPTRHTAGEKLTPELLIKTFEKIVRQTVVPLKICLFIDGLDEYEGEASDMADLFTNMVTSDNIKICLSSRPLVPLKYAFKSSAMIRLQDLTFEDIRRYVSEQLHANTRFQQLAREESDKAHALVNEIVTKADGVFLWVVLVVRSISIGLGNRDEIADLERRLQELPTSLSALFKNMLMHRIERFYQVKAAELFQIVRAARHVNDHLERLDGKPTPLTLLALSFAAEKDAAQPVGDDPLTPLTDLEISARCNAMDDRLKTCCAGLLEVAGSNSEDLGTVTVDNVVLPWAKVQYLHRTVKDYLEQVDVWSTITAKTEGSDFEPDISLLRSCLLLVKTDKLKKTQPIPDATFHRAYLGLEYARQAELKGHPAYVPILDQLDYVMGLVLKNAGGGYPGHWGRYCHVGQERPMDWEDNTLALAVEYQLCAYLDFKLRQSSIKKCKKPGRPLLDYAISQHPYKQRYGINPEVLETLLSNNADPNYNYKHMTPWENALAFAYEIQLPTPGRDSYRTERVRPPRDEVLSLIAVFRHFLQYGADLKATHIRESGKELSVLFVVNDVFMRWYPNDSAELLGLIEQREEAKNSSSFSRILGWRKAKEKEKDAKMVKSKSRFWP